MTGLNENEFWLALWNLTNDECSRHDDSTIPHAEQFMAAIESIAQKIESTNDGWYVVRSENPVPKPAEPTINFLLFGCLLGNYLAWRSGVNFFHMVKEKH